MKKIKFLLIPLFILVIAGLAYSQGTPHLVYGYVQNEDTSTPDSICIIFKAWIIGGNDTVTHSDSGCGYNGGVWGVQCSNFPDAQTGDTLVITITDTCRGEVCVVWGLIDFGVPYEDFGFHTMADTVFIMESDKTLPYGYGFIDVYPNPFNSRANIRISRSAKNAHVSIYNMLGTKCRDLYNGAINEGKILSWDGKDSNNAVLPGGTYICRVELDGEAYYTQIKFLK